MRLDDRLPAASAQSARALRLLWTANARALMVADIFPKALGEEEYLKFRTVLMNERLSVMLADAMGRVVKLGGRAAQLWNRLVSHCVRT